MSEETFRWVVTAGVLLAAISMVVQAAAAFGLYRATKALQEKAMPLVPRAQAILETAQTTLDQSRVHIVELTAKARDISNKADEMMDVAKVQMQKLDSVVTDASGRAKVQMDRAELVIDDTVSRVSETVAVVHNGVMKPLREVSGFANGIRAALQHLARGGRPNVTQVTQDEEMFI